jgi:hypothetical protein
MSTNEDRQYDRLGATARTVDRPLRELVEIMREQPGGQMDAGPVEMADHQPISAARIRALEEANARRTAEAAAAVTERVRVAMQILAQPYRCAGLSPACVDAGRLRLRHQDLSYAELAGLCKPPVSRDVYVGRLRRLLQHAGLNSEDHEVAHG